MEYEFPFEVPADLQALSAEDFATFAATVGTHVTAVLEDQSSSAEALTATRDLYNAVTAEQTRRTELAEAAATARAELTAGLAAPAAPATQPDVPTTTPPVPPAVPATTPPAATASTLDEPPAEVVERYVSMTASSDAPGAGMELDTFDDAVRLISRRLDTYSSATKKGGSSARRIPHTNTFVMNGRTMVRHGNVAFRRNFPDDLRITDAKNALTVLDYATNEKRLPGGSLIKSMEKQVAAGRSLTAAAGWCAPSETLYDLCALETVDGLLDLSEIQALRGGFFIPEDGGPDFASIFEGIGDEGDVILTEYQVQNGVNKVCVEIPCPPFTEVRMDVAYVCLTGSLLQDRGYPEIVTRFSQGAMVALAHKINESKIARIVAASGGPIVIETIPGSDDAVSQLLSAIELAIEDIKYRNRMARAATLEVVLPAWVIAPMRAALARRRGVSSWDVSDAEILAAFTTRRAVPRFVYDWQDAFSGLSGGPGGSSPLTEFPDTVQFLVYPAGTWTSIVRDVINLDTVYDNALLTENQYTALFAEDGFNVMQMCVDSRLYQVGIDPAGIVGCCAAES